MPFFIIIYTINEKMFYLIFKVLAQNLEIPEDALQNPEEVTMSSGYENLKVFFFDLFRIAPFLIAPVVAGVIIYSGFKLILSRGNQEEAQKSWRGIFQAVLGFIFLVIFIIVAYSYLMQTSSTSLD
ncbi:hypothetical protein A2483_04840 [Candidatus Peregrinibacteria bacterium RIFOXYC2_FULL_33_13]|nr:MAG: hypothetical protein UR30_C0002G0063 [Candidatus Peregrinibacteria bacterium GW2011_GWC2_33_13]OGJ49861.1 MAG: hypothetical protein A2229_00070 [Candidatus Peregrinibacteria bacterium RIFOXYA2_FULL_33_7]OGJ55278.1 MAG: hypothetical protein A2483_04840 [Candidatus Peregrinibacteria bacterium RIFOXYC2_FULL_33_13]